MILSLNLRLGNRTSASRQSAPHKQFHFRQARIYAKLDQRHVIGDEHGRCGARTLRLAGFVGTAFIVRGVLVAADQINCLTIQTMRNSQPAIAITTAIK
jgi:hypothetical protein